MMDVSILLHTNNSGQYLVSFFQSIMKQTSKIRELIILDEHSTDATISIAEEIKLKSPFDVNILSILENTDVYRTGLEHCYGNIILFAKAEHPFKPQKVSLFKRFFEEDPYLKFVYSNLEAVDEELNLQIDDFLGISGFYEKWDYYKSLPDFLIKESNFILPIQLGISDKVAEKFLQFLSDYPTLETSLSFTQLLTIFIALKYPDTIREIPYVLNQYRLSEKEIVCLKENKKAVLEKSEKLAWLKDYSGIATLIDKDHEIIQKIHKATLFTEKTQKKYSKFSALINYIFGHYHRYSFTPYSDFQRDFFK